MFSAMNKEVGGKLPVIPEDKSNIRHGTHPSRTISNHMTSYTSCTF